MNDGRNQLILIPPNPQSEIFTFYYFSVVCRIRSPNMLSGTSAYFVCWTDRVSSSQCDLCIHFLRSPKGNLYINLYFSWSVYVWACLIEFEYFCLWVWLWVHCVFAFVCVFVCKIFTLFLKLRFLEITCFVK